MRFVRRSSKDRMPVVSMFVTATNYTNSASYFTLNQLNAVLKKEEVSHMKNRQQEIVLELGWFPWLSSQFHLLPTSRSWNWFNVIKLSFVIIYYPPSLHDGSVHYTFKRRWTNTNKSNAGGTASISLITRFCRDQEAFIYFLNILDATVECKGWMHGLWVSSRQPYQLPRFRELYNKTIRIRMLHNGDIYRKLIEI